MAETVNVTKRLEIVAEFESGDTYQFSLNNPKEYSPTPEAQGDDDYLDPADITDLADYMKTNKIVIGDKAGADFTRIKSAKKISQTTRYLDLND